MFSFIRDHDSGPIELPLFPLHTVLYPGGLLPLKVFEQRYIEMTKACLSDEKPFGVCLITEGAEVADRAQGAAGAPQFAPIGTLAAITAWDMPQLGILHVRTIGGARFQVRSHKVQPDGLVVGEVTAIADEPAVALSDVHRPLAQLLQVLTERIGPDHFAPTRAFDDASWVGYRLAELLPLPLPIKQSMLEINDSEVRLSVLSRFLRQQGLI
jgi:Lon protease-like protein